jgi:hypothetical protein
MPSSLNPPDFKETPLGTGGFQTRPYAILAALVFSDSLDYNKLPESHLDD